MRAITEHVCKRIPVRQGDERIECFLVMVRVNRKTNRQTLRNSAMMKGHGADEAGTRDPRVSA